jgi:hypothetical protein
MSLFDYPRINIKGTIQLSPGTANNDDYAGAYVLPDTWGPFAGETLALIDSKKVAARTYGMSDDDFVAWVQKAQTFVQTGPEAQTSQIIPAEWNYYGAMDSNVIAATVIGVQTAPHSIYAEPTDSVPLTAILGSQLTFSGHFTDVNSEGSPPATQFFIDQLDLKQPDGTSLLSGTLSKGACQWLNFYRNVNLTADAGAGGYVYHVMHKSQPGTTINIPPYREAQISGVIFRYYLYRPLQGTTSNAGIEAIYEQKQTNPATLEIIGTFAPLYEHETILTTPTGRLMVSNTANIPTPAGSHNNGANGHIALAPAVLQRHGDIISADFVGTFPDYFHAAEASSGTAPPGVNPKYNFGPVSLVVSNSTKSAEVGAVNYANTVAGDQQGWVFDFDIASNQDAQHVLGDPNATFTLVHASCGNVLEETDYYFVSNQQAMYTEQFGSGTEFLNQGTTEPATISVYHRGQKLSGASCPPITLWQYRSIPLQAPGDAEALSTHFKPGEPIVVDTSQPGNFLFTFSVSGRATPGSTEYPPQSYSTFMNPPFITNAPSISLRILPNDEDFSRYYVDPSAAEPVGNALLTFDVLYDKVLRTYYLLYPAMNGVFPLNSEQAVAQKAGAILQVTDPAIWMSIDYMPRTRDMSASRRRLLRAWCRKVLAGQ